MKRVLHVSASDGNGGAARAAFRIHRSLVSVEALTGIESSMLVRNRVSDNQRVIPIYRARGLSAVDRSTRRLAKMEKKLLKSENRIIHSTARIRTRALRQIMDFEPEAVVLHWLGNDVLSIEQVGALSRSGIPLLWVLHDTWAFCGAEHYPHGIQDRRFVTGYSRENRPPWESGLDLNRITANRKVRHWTSPIHIIAPSRWMAEMAGASAMMGTWPISVIPNPMETAWWGGITRDEARQRLGIPHQRRVILFGAMGGEKDPRKGADLLRAALGRFSDTESAELLDNVQVLTFGGKRRTDEVAGLKIESLGLLDDHGLRRAYTAADVMVVPSRLENLPQTATESIACGTPVVGFRVGGMSDIVGDETSGRLVDPFSTDALGDAIAWVLRDSTRWQALSRESKATAARWEMKRVGHQYAELLGSSFL